MSCGTAQLVWPDKDPGDTLDFELKAEDAIPSGDTIQTIGVAIANVTVPPLTNPTNAVDAGGRTAIIWLAGGLVGEDYEIVVTLTTNSTPNRVIERTVLLQVRDQ